MNKISSILIFIVFVYCAHCFQRDTYPYPYYPPSKRQIFGETEGERIGYQHETRWGFPFFRREALFVFPSVSNDFNINE